MNHCDDQTKQIWLTNYLVRRKYVEFVDPPLLHFSQRAKVRRNRTLAYLFTNPNKMKMKVIIPSIHCRHKKWFFQPPVMSFGFLDVIFWGKGLEIDIYKPPNFIWSYHIHMVNVCWPKWPKTPKLTYLSNFDVKNSIKAS